MDSPFRQPGEAPPVALRCLYCGSSRDADSACTKCGAEPMTHAAFADIAGRPCPRCKGPLARVHLESTARVEQCAQCHGCFVTAADFSEIINAEEAGDGATLRRFVPIMANRTLPSQSLLAVVRCPHCYVEMDRTRFAQRAAIVVDVCPAHGIWLDAGELLLIIDFVARRLVGDTTPDQADSEDANRWDRIRNMREEEERVVMEHASIAESLAASHDVEKRNPWSLLFEMFYNRRR